MTVIVSIDTERQILLDKVIVLFRIAECIVVVVAHVLCLPVDRGNPAFNLSLHLGCQFAGHFAIGIEGQDEDIV